jgi:hypothetical protein
MKSEQIGDCLFEYVSELGNPTKQCGSVEQMHDDCVETARGMLVRTAADGRDFVPLAMVYMPLEKGPKLAMCMVMGWNQKSKHEVGKGLAAFAAKQNAAALVLVTDGWAVKGLRDTAEARRIRPSLHPDRVEVLSANLIYPDGQCVGVLMEYKRVPIVGAASGEGAGASEQAGEPDGEGVEKATIEWGEMLDGRIMGGHRVEQGIVPAWQVGGTQ